MFKRLKRIEQKLDKVIKGQQIQDRILADIADTLDQRRAAGGLKTKALDEYVGQVSGLLEQKGAAPEFINAFKNLFQRIR